MFGSNYTKMIEILLFVLGGTRLMTISAKGDPSLFDSRRKVSSLLLKHLSTNSFKTIPFVGTNNKFTNDLITTTSISLLRDEQKTQLLLQSIRAGGGGVVKKSKAKKTAASSGTISSLQQQQQWQIILEKFKEKKKAFLLLTSSIVLSYILFHTRSTWMSLLFNREKLQAYVVESLEKLNSFPYFYSRLFYTICMTLWETMGMSTIPVETAAGMVFGWSGLYWSGIGKLLGACLAFGLGRSALFSSFVETKLKENTFLNLVQSSTKDNPLLVVTLMKMSCFPETIKNFGSSVLKPIRWWMFILGTAVHGWIFTALWTYFGVDTAARIKDIEGLLPPDPRLKLLLTLAVFNGCVVSPLSMAYWIKTLKQKQTTTIVSDKKKSEKINKK